MNTRTQWLLAGVAILAILYTGDYLYRSLIEEPSRKATAALDRLDNQLQQAADSQLVAKKISQKMESYNGRSLPYEAEVARSLYQDWLLKLMERHTMTGISIDASAPVPIEIKSRTNKKKTLLVGYRITYTVHGKTAYRNGCNGCVSLSKRVTCISYKTLPLSPWVTEVSWMPT